MEFDPPYQRDHLVDWLRKNSCGTTHHCEHDCEYFLLLRINDHEDLTSILLTYSDNVVVYVDGEHTTVIKNDSMVLGLIDNSDIMNKWNDWGNWTPWRSNMEETHYYIIIQNIKMGNLTDLQEIIKNTIREQVAESQPLKIWRNTMLMSFESHEDRTAVWLMLIDHEALARPTPWTNENHMRIFRGPPGVSEADLYRLYPQNEITWEY